MDWYISPLKKLEPCPSFEFSSNKGHDFDFAVSERVYFLSPAPQDEPQEAGFSFGFSSLSPAPQDEPQEAGFSFGFSLPSSAPQDEPQEPPAANATALVPRTLWALRLAK
jgi:hypothetical protein